MLMKPWTLGQAVPGGGPGSAGGNVIIHYNALASSGKSVDELRDIGNRDGEVITRRLAAKSLCRALRNAVAKNGRPYAADDLDRILDRTDGKATQRIAVVSVTRRDPAQIREELQQLLSDQPALAESLGLPITHEPITAEPITPGDADDPPGPPTRS